MDKPRTMIFCLTAVAVATAGCATTRPEIVDSFTLEDDLVEISIHRQETGGVKTLTWIAKNNHSSWPVCVSMNVSDTGHVVDLDHERVVTIFPGASIPVAELVTRSDDKYGWKETRVDVAWFGDGGAPCRLTGARD